VIGLARTESFAVGSDLASAGTTETASALAQTLISALASATAWAAFADRSFSAEKLPPASVLELFGVPMFLFALGLAAAASAWASGTACAHGYSAFDHARSKKLVRPILLRW